MDPISLLVLAACLAIVVFAAVQWKKKKFRDRTGSQKVALVSVLGLGTGVLFVILSRGLPWGIASGVRNVAIVLAALSLIVLVFSLAGLIADLAKVKGRSWAAFFWLSILFSPLIMWIIVAVMSPLPGSETYISPTGSFVQTEPALDISAQIKKLSVLKDEGVLTESEFESKKAELLARI